jgi:hypothetical protein
LDTAIRRYRKAGRFIVAGTTGTATTGPGTTGPGTTGPGRHFAAKRRRVGGRDEACAPARAVGCPASDASPGTPCSAART